MEVGGRERGKGKESKWKWNQSVETTGQSIERYGCDKKSDSAQSKLLQQQKILLVTAFSIIDSSE